MDSALRRLFDDLRSKDKTVQGEAYQSLLALAEPVVPWAYEVWDGLVASLADRDNRLRSISGQLLCSLAKSDPEYRLARDFPALLAVTKDERFVTARHVLQSLWRIGLAGDDRRALLLSGLAARYRECGSEKSGHLVRTDIMAALRNLHAAGGAADVEDLALGLIDGEADPAQKKKLAAEWRRKA
jgi:hypothetical protein